MKQFTYVLAVTALFILSFMSCNSAPKQPKQKQDRKLQFAFLTDIHLNMGDNNCYAGFQKAIDKAKDTGADFIITGGDNCDIDVLKDDVTTAHAIYKRFGEMIQNSDIPVYPAIGNHDRFWGVKEDNSLYNEGLFEKYVERKSYYTFNQKNWHFIVLNTANSVVDATQKEWLQKELLAIPAEKPVIVIVHVPFLSVYYPALEGRYTSTDTFENFKEIWDLFKNHNLKLVLQGHQHLYEEIKVLNTQFITGGAVSASWWGGSYHGTEEGFLNISIDHQDNVTWNYVDYGWEVNK